MVTLRRSIGDRSLSSFFDFDKGLVNREIYTNEGIYQQELEQIFGRCWLFLGHESQVPNPGDFVITRMGEEEVIMVRDRKDKQIHAFLNSCRHKGMKVCRYDDGNTLVFTCPFHGWTYGTDGRLVGVAFYDDAYNKELDKSQWGLHEVAQLRNFYGSIWATWDAKAPSFEDYVGAYAPSIRHCFQSSDGEDNGMELFNPVVKWRLPTNWKVGAFSFAADLTHGAMTHRSVNVAAIGPQGDREGGERFPIRAPFPAKDHTVGDHNLGHGGSYKFYEQPGVREYTDTWVEAGVDEYYRQTNEAKAKKYANTVMPGSGYGGGHFAIFPNVVIDHWRILPWHPHGVGVMETWRMYQVDKNAPKHVKDAQRHYVMRYCGPTGVTETDDMENWNYVFPASLGIMAQKLPYHYAMQIGHGQTDERVPGFTLSNGRGSEEPARARFSRWLAFMEAKSWDDLYPIKKSANGDNKLFR